ncbi:MAG: hypothetical protein NUV98_02985 [Candidatus Roizmanbacteria bacterium]|nr:hypothetical protein [Candidatus Roizmanbacteria bacterium]
MAGFSLRGHILGAQNPILEYLIISDSDTIAVGDAVSMSAGFVIPATSSTRVYGICVGLVNNKGIDLQSAPTSTYDGTYTDSSQTYVATSDNTTDKKVKAVVCPDPFALWYNDSSGTLTTAHLKTFFNLTDKDQVDQGTSSATIGQVQLWKLDPDEDSDASKGLFKLAAWQGESFTPAS